MIHAYQALSVLLVVTTTGCGESDLSIRLDPGSGDNPFDGVSTIQVAVDAPDLPKPLREQTPYRSGGSLTLPQIPLGPDRVVTVEGLDANGLVIARGVSQPFTLTNDAPGRIIIVFSRCQLLRYPDADHDRYGNTDAQKFLCTEAAGFIETGGDCDDGDQRVNPAQQQYFSSPRANGGGYDYNCDGRETPQHPQAVNCATATPSCKDAAGWIGSVPACGEAGSWASCEKEGQDCVVDNTSRRLQSCR